MPLDLVLHIGSGKTGTSSIQYFLHRNRARLAEMGHLYPQTPGRRRHTQLGLFVQPDDALDDIPSWNPDRWDSPADFRKAFRRRLFREIDESGLSRVLMSDEALYGSPDEALRRLGRFTGRIAKTLRVVVYLRRQDDHLVSRYQQVVKIGETRRLAERTPQVNFSKTYDYYGRLSTWQQLVAPTELVVRRFERDSFVDGSLYQDFLEAVGIAARADELEQVEPVNESLDAEAVELMRMLNVFRAKNDTAKQLLPSNHVMVTRLAAVSSGPVLTLPPEFLDEFMAQWEESNRRVALELLGDDSGQLFRTPRKTANTTTEQRLDPERLDHFLTVLELPEPLHAPLRELVEREAEAEPVTARGMSTAWPRGSGARSRSGELPAYYDPAAVAVIERVRERTMTQPEKLFGLILATRYVARHRIPGDIVECGVWRGGSMQAAALSLLEAGDTGRHLHLYDTFEGMTPPEDVDRRRDGMPAAELLENSSRDSRVWGVATLEDVKSGMAEIDYPPERVHFHPGRVEDTIPGEAPEAIAILRLDTDWYASTRHELEHLYDRLSPGGVLIIDDYGYWEGSRRATEEFLAGSGAQLLLVPIADGVIAVKPGLPGRSATS